MNRNQSKKSPIAVFCSALGMVLLILFILFCLPLTVPKLLGYEIYSVISGSMEPAIPTGSLLYIQSCTPEEMKEEEIIAFYGGRDSNAIITHRVVENRVLMGEFITKGDANATEDRNPVPYGDFIGKVVRSVPYLGKVALLLTTLYGKAAAAAMVVLAALLHGIAGILNGKQ